MNITARPSADFRLALQDLIGSECWSVIAGEGTGSHVILNIGRKVRRKKRILNRHLSEEQRTYEGEFSLYILCVWRLDSANAVACGAWDDNSFEGPMLRGLSQLEGDVVKSVELSEPGLDLVLQFRRDLSLRIFCDQVNEMDKNDNYTLFTPTEEFTVGCRSLLEVRKRAGRSS